ncbi:F-box/kelch-repeat protein-like protein [Tanacetum coccineum]
MKHSFFILLEGLISLEDIFTLHTRDRLPLDIKRGYKRITGVELPSDISDANIVGSCNGILCLKSYNRLISLWNFSVRRKVAVPAHPSIGASKEVPNVVFGFGYDRIAHDYNIVGISYSSDKGIARNDSSFIYSMKTDSWSMIAPPTSLFTKVSSNACFLNENLHWVVFSATDSNFIMTFSLATRVFGTIQLPKNWRQEGGCQLTIINGSLAVICRTWVINYDTIIWLMREYNNVESWFIFFQLQTKDYDDINVLQPIANDNLVIYDKSNERIYDDKKKSFTEIQKFIPNLGEVEMETYVESLELLDRGIPCGTTVFPSKKRRFTSLNYNVDRDDDDCLYDDAVDDDDDDDDLDYEDHCCCGHC